MNKENLPLAPLFGKAKWFAIVEDENVTIKQNTVDGGRAVVEWLADSGVGYHYYVRDGQKSL